VGAAKKNLLWCLLYYAASAALPYASCTTGHHPVSKPDIPQSFMKNNELICNPFQNGIASVRKWYNITHAQELPACGAPQYPSE
jgi:hypothetical protein